MTTDSLTYISKCLSSRYVLAYCIEQHVNHIIETADRIPIVWTAEHLDTLESLDELTELRQD